ncbi:intradiol ring-cleavage dioxygenase [Azohydromonas caseinilytica]|uniref:Intradiol ring-cleavage dioxygenase n=1 Tax=Azohydromonas caseinilytica TaxID=2728836 RepID=A0A848FAZ1_9BURK|nr:intradiol ring-cleavage dioxygenase [Azohydromonas caseinilytica]NML17367.1 intradiol ring-cleavage dioxygenase [Azohydromonas caseinilytica]
MRNIDEFSITQAVLGSLEGCKDARLKEVLAALVRHLHDFAREVRLTEAELMQGIDFLTAVGQKCDDKRQEFVLLSDTLGLSMLTVALNHARPAGATQATVFGPFHVEDAPRMEQGDDIAGGAPGEPLDVDVCVCALDGTPIPDAEVDVWQADEQGLYDVQIPALGQQRRARAVMRTDAEGRLRFRSIVPTAYPIPTDGPVGRMLVATGRHPWRPAHVHFMVKAPGYQTLITHVFRDADPYLDSDVVFGVRDSLVARFDKKEVQGARRLDFRFVMAPRES